jgi:hypothetical protein
MPEAPSGDAVPVTGTRSRKPHTASWWHRVALFLHELVEGFTGSPATR